MSARPLSRNSFAASTYPTPSNGTGGKSASPFTLTDVFINATNGNDLLDGTTFATAWKTNARLYSATEGTFINPPTQLLTVHYVGPTSPPQSDPFRLEAILGPDVIILRDFRAIPLTVLHTSTLTAAPRQINAATNTPTGLTDAATTWAPLIGKQLQFATGEICTLLKDEGAHVVRTSPIVNLTFIGNLPSATINYPLNGTAYSVVQLPDDWRGAVELQSEGAPAATALFQSNLQTVGATPRGVLDYPPGDPWEPMVTVIDVACNFEEGYNSNLSSTQQHEFIACGGHADPIGGGLTMLFGAGQFTFDACGFIGAIAIGSGAYLFGQNDTILQGDAATSLGGVCVFQGGVLNVLRMASFDAPASFVNPFGDGFTCTENDHSGIGAVITQTSGGGAMYGSGNAGVGWRVQRGATHTAAIRPTVTGTGGDFSLVGTGSFFVFNIGTGAYSTPPTANSWANLQGAGGLGHEPQYNAHLLIPGG